MPAPNESEQGMWQMGSCEQNVVDTGDYCFDKQIFRAQNAVYCKYNKIMLL